MDGWMEKKYEKNGWLDGLIKIYEKIYGWLDG